jgi:type IV secretion system protein VirB10
MFAQRAGNEQPPTTHAVALSDPGQIIAQGTLIPAVLETALNSDLPGFARAIVSRDVRSFDGSRTLVPRGSRLIGQYKSGLATGQSRAYIIWTRVLRPDGVSVQLGSPVMDEKGEVGLSGDVNRHFWQRFGSSILLSVVAGATSAISSGSSTVVIGTSGAQSAASAALEADAKIPPTIRVPLGTPIQVFAARDLDFSGYTISHAPASP